MPANLTVVEGKEAAAFNTANGHPWHRLGFQVEANMTIDEALKLSYSDDIVEPDTLYTIDHDKVIEIDGVRYVAVDDLEDVECSIAVKSDRYGVMSTPGPKYEITQRREILELAYEFEGLDRDGCHIDTIGNIGEKGEVFFSYVRVPNLVIDENGIADEIEHGLVVCTSFDGTYPNSIGPSYIRVVCNNTLEAAYKAGGAKWIKVRHTRFSEDRMRTAAVALGYLGKMDDMLVHKAEQMLKVQGERAWNKVADHLWDLSDDDMPQSTRTRRETERAMFRMCYDGPGNTAVKKVGKNGWAVYQAFTEFTDHRRPVRADFGGTRRASDAVLPGKVTNDKAKVSEIILAK